MRRFLTRSVLAVFLAMPLAMPEARATTVLKVSVKEMTSIAEWVVRARVVAVTNVVSTEGGGGPFTDVRVALDEVYHGPKDAKAPRELVSV